MNGIPILTYHSLHARDESYANNDHVALAGDLATLDDLGYSIVPLSDIAERLITGDSDWFSTGKKAGISFDDGCNHDYTDFVWPGLPTLKSFYTILSEFKHLNPSRPPVCATSFVIASPVATAVLDRTCIAGRDQWHDGWWKPAAVSGLIEIGNHSWDHLHPTLPFVCHSRDARNDFSQVDNAIDAAMQIQQAEDYIRRTIGDGHATGLFAYPDGKSNPYLVSEFFPAQENVLAAFTTGGRRVDANTDRWLIPRYVCGEHWNSPDALVRLLQDPS
jgi:hypothetical protein